MSESAVDAVSEQIVATAPAETAAAEAAPAEIAAAEAAPAEIAAAEAAPAEIAPAASMLSDVQAEAPAAETTPAPESTPASAATRASSAASSRRRARAAKAPAASALATARPPRRHRIGARVKVAGAGFAVAALLTGTLLPALSQADEPSRTTAASVAGQSFTAADDLVADVTMRDSYSATTPDEISAARASAISAAVASGVPLSSVVNLSEAKTVLIPLDAGTYEYTETFGAPRPGRTHMGQDLAASIGTPIHAAMDGCVSMSSESYSGYGVTIEIESLRDGQNVTTVYSHLNSGTRAVQVGDCVSAGDYIGDVGDTGFTEGSCLHFEVHINGTAIDPLAWLNANVG